ncbi:MAG: phosphonopyruvate decarboxylase [Rhodospirillaceae bacterium]|jgi:sulfopyruvate decarboxylase alpha subunit|nr:phosphonopyruvate decarboxylase [Rhodospirillaceae bacterium]
MARAATKKKTPKKAAGKLDWPSDVFRVLKESDVRQIAYVPDAGHTDLIKKCIADNVVRAVPLTAEQEGVAVLAGAWLGGEAGALLMQSSGVGNIINMLGMTNECRFPLLMLVTMRGEWGEFNPWQVPMGQATEKALQAAGVICHRVDNPAEIAETVEAAAKLAFQGGRMVAVLIGQRVVGFKDWTK